MKNQFFILLKQRCCCYHFVLCLLVFFALLPSTIQGQNTELLLSTGQTVTNYVDTLIASYDVVLFGKSYCDYCHNVRNLFEQLRDEAQQQQQQQQPDESDRWTYQYIELDTILAEDGMKIQNELIEKTNRKGVPSTFILGENYLGYNAVKNLYDAGELQDLLLFKNKRQEL